MNKIWSQTQLQFKGTTLTKHINIATYFENQIDELYVLYLLKTLQKFMPIRYCLPFDPQTYFLCIILYYKNSKFKYLINEAIKWWIC